MHLISTYNSSVGGNTAGSEKRAAERGRLLRNHKPTQADHRWLTCYRVKLAFYEQVRAVIKSRTSRGVLTLKQELACHDFRKVFQRTRSGKTYKKLHLAPWKVACC